MRGGKRYTVGYTNLVSNKSEWNIRFVKFANLPLFTFTKRSLLLKRIKVVGWSEFTAITVALVFHKQLYG